MGPIRHISGHVQRALSEKKAGIHEGKSRLSTAGSGFQISSYSTTLWLHRAACISGRVDILDHMTNVWLYITRR